MRKSRKPMDFGGPALAERQAEPAFEPELIDAEPDLDLAVSDGPVMEPPLTVRVAEDSQGELTTKPVGAVAAEPRFRPAPAAPETKGSAIYAGAAIVSLLWALAPITFWMGFTRQAGPFTYEPFVFVMLGVIAVGPIALIWFSAYMLRQGVRLSAEARHARKVAEDMLQPAAMASAGTGAVVETVRIEIEHATAAAAQARHELATLSEVLASETARLVEAAAGSARTATTLTEAFGHERQELGTLAQALDAQAVEVGEAITRQARMVAEASDLAETQIREAEAALAARAADLVAAAGETTDATRIAGEDIARQTARLEAAGTGVAEQIRSAEENLAEQRAALVAVSHTLRAEQEDFAAQIESQQAQLSEILHHARSGAGELEDTAARGGEALKKLVDQAVNQYRELAEAASEERDLFGAAALQSVGALTQAVRHERDALAEETHTAIDALARAAEDARNAASVQAEAARQKIDELGEAAFAAGQKADSAFEARLSEAQALIEQSAELVDQAGERAAERMTASLETARDAVAQLEILLAEVEARTARLPVDAQERSEEVKAAVERGMDELMGAARKAAEETQAIDSAFQERVHRNYEMLSEAVRLMGVVGGTASPTRPLRSAAASRLGASDLARTPAPDTPLPADAAGLRPRLKLTPTATDEEFNTVFEQASGRAPEPPAAEGHEWTWKDLLSSIDEAPEGEDRLADKMVAAIETLGIDPQALMPRQRIDEIAAAMQTGDQLGAREVVRKLAPAAVRRLSRRILTDIALRSQAGRFLKRHEAALDEAAAQDHEGFAMAELLGSREGRAFLLIDAAVGDLS